MGRLLSRHCPRSRVFDLVGPLAPAKMYLNTADPFQSEMACGSYQKPLIAKVLQLAGPGDVVLTAGAQLGYMVIALAKALGPTGRILAFEADPRMVGLCKRNITLNGLEAMVQLVPTGLGVSNASLQMSLSSTAGQSSFAITHHHLDYATVSVRNGDEVLSEMGVDRIDGLLLDVEGWELQVVNGLRKTLSGSTPRWAIVECWDVALKSAESSAKELLNALSEFGWQTRSIDGTEPKDGSDIVCTRM